MKLTKLKDIFEFRPKSKLKAGQGGSSGNYPFYTSSEKQSKYIDIYQYVGKCLVFGTGGKANLHLTPEYFSTSADCITISSKQESETHLDYVYFYFKGNMRVLEDGFQGAGLKHISKAYLSEIKIPLPPLADQIKIAQLLGKVETLIAQRKHHLTQLDTLLKSIFLDLFGDPVTNEKGWEKSTIGNLAHEIKYGTSAPAKGGEYTYLRMNNITREGNWDFTSVKYIDSPQEEFDKYSVKKGDLVFNRTNSKELVGKTAIYTKDKPAIIAGYLIRVRFNSQTNPWFVWGHLNSKYGKQYLFKLCRNIVGMANINTSELKAIPILNPPLSLQNHFASIVEKVETLKTRYEHSLRDLECLYKNLSHHAFTGKLDLSHMKIKG